jgi:hypothetical protein
MDFTRRKFMKMTAAGAAAMSLGFGVRTPEAQASAASIATFLSIDPVTLAYKIFSSCCYYCTDKFIVSHYQPVALIEVIKGGGDSALGVGLGSLFSTGVDNNDYTTFEARIYEIPSWAIAMAMAYQDCKLCGVDKAKTGNPKLSSATSVCSAATDQIVSKAVSQFNKAMPACMPKLLYSTEFDPAWRTGCRDMAHTFLSNPITCNELTGNISMFGMELCIGPKWGPLYPRQMATQNDSAPIAAGIAAYRAIHVSAFAQGSFPFNGSLAIGKLQQTSPMVTVGFGAGSMMLDTQMRAGPVDPMHTYTFVWWVPVTCCKDYEEIMGICDGSSSFCG